MSVENSPYLNSGLQADNSRSRLSNNLRSFRRCDMPTQINEENKEFLISISDYRDLPKKKSSNLKDWNRSKTL